MQSLNSFPASISAKRATPVSRLTRAGLVLGLCAALGAGILAAPHATTAQHTAVVSAHMVASGSITGGPGNG